jgi:anti-anti-sigma factor
VLDRHFAIATDPVGVGDDGVMTTRVRLAGDLDIATRDDLRDALLGVIEAGECALLLVDLRQVRFIDSEALSALIEGYLAAERAGVAFRLVEARGIVERVLTVVGLDHLCGPQ